MTDTYQMRHPAATLRTRPSLEKKDGVVVTPSASMRLILCIYCNAVGAYYAVLTAYIPMLHKVENKLLANAQLCGGQ
ncbi:uncharacterized protein EAF01_004299 [Botrytis porri]|uniref:uncharacterized protein n=1 Tax=Botrytis porri TaxID=87229 RepID=UPI001901D7F1|nr:uncharacterized protein EAF01_004299 [Botrytis porri]KAF7908544.1 hypothetical protein EAF01_004299 [Botrytis porri]